jgi:hypothetical protein
MHTKKKLSRICSLEAYNRANDWHRSKQNVPEHAKTTVDSIYSNTADRFYLSKWMERFIVRFINDQQPTWKAVKVDNRGKAIPNKIVGGKRDGEVIGVLTYAKNPNEIEGEPDIEVKRPIPLHSLYFEIKIGNDRLSDAQKKFIAAGFGECYVIKTLDQFFAVWDFIV